MTFPRNDFEAWALPHFSGGDAEAVVALAELDSKGDYRSTEMRAARDAWQQMAAQRDALAAHAGDVLSALNSTTDEFECCVRVGKVVEEGPEVSLAARDGRLADAIERAAEDRAMTEDCPRYEAGMRIAASMVRHWHKEGA